MSVLGYVSLDREPNDLKPWADNTNLIKYALYIDGGGG
jgi:hypothetical protein